MSARRQINFSRLIINVAFLLLSFTVAFLFAEIVVRTCCPQVTGPSEWSFDPDLGLISVPNHHGTRSFPGIFSYHFTNNSMGLRGSREYSEKPEGLRILLLGDSFTYGIGVNDDQTFAHITEKNLKDVTPHLEVMNAGVPSTGTDYALRFYTARGWRFGSRIVVLCFYSNDFQDNEHQRSYLVNADGSLTPTTINPKWQMRNILVKSSFYNWLMSWSQAGNLLRVVATAIFGKNWITSAWFDQSQYKNGYSDDSNVRKTKILINNLKNAILKQNAAFYIFYIPDKNDVQYYIKNGKISKDELNITAIASELKIGFLSLTPRFSLETDQQGLYFPEDMHFTPQGHAIAAKVLSLFLPQAINKLSAPAISGP